MWLLLNKDPCSIPSAIQSEILESRVIFFFDPHSLQNLIPRFACYASLRSDFAIASLCIKFQSFWGSKKKISLSTKKISLFIFNGIEQSIMIYSANFSRLFTSLADKKQKSFHSQKNVKFACFRAFWGFFAKVRDKFAKNSTIFLT